MRAALTASERGHIVHLYESSPQLGGQLYLAAAPPDRSDAGLAMRATMMLEQAGDVKLAAAIGALTGWHFAIGALMVVVGASLVAFFTWDRHWLVRYTVLPVLLGSELEVKGVSVQPPSLQSVFITLTGKELRD